jgi:hypothetical protein
MNKNKFLIDLAESERTDFGRVEFGQQSEAQQVFSAIWELEAQVNNGGFDQYFRTSDFDSIAFAPTALRALGAASCADVVERAIGVIAPLASKQEGRCRALDSLAADKQEYLSALDAEFFSYPDDLTDGLFEYVSRHPHAFGQIPSESVA